MKVKFLLYFFFLTLLAPAVFSQDLIVTEYTPLTRASVNIKSAIKKKLSQREALNFVDLIKQKDQTTHLSFDKTRASEICEQRDANFLIFGNYAIRNENIAINHWIYNAKYEQFSRFLQYGKRNQVPGALATEFSDKFFEIINSRFITENIPENEKLILITNLPQEEYNNIAMGLIRANYSLSSVHAQHQAINLRANEFLFNMHTKQSSLLNNVPENYWSLAPNPGQLDNKFIQLNATANEKTYQRIIQQESSFESLKAASGAGYLVFLFEQEDQYYGRAVNLNNGSLTWWNDNLELKPNLPLYNGSYLKSEFESFGGSTYGLQKIIGKNKNKAATIAFITFENKTGSNDYDWVGPSLTESMHFDMSSQFKYSRTPSGLTEQMATSVYSQQKELQTNENQMTELAKRFREQLDCDFLITGYYEKSKENSINVYSLLINLHQENSIIKFETDFPINNTMFNKFAKVSTQMIDNISNYAQKKKDVIEREVLISLSEEEISLFEKDMPALVSGYPYQRTKRNKQ
jgi:hypothetical protein